MVDFSIKIANEVIAVRARHMRTKSLCNQYLTSLSADFCVHIDDNSIEKAYRSCESERKKEGLSAENIPEYFLEEQALLFSLAEALPMHNAALFHGSAICVDDKAYLFLAPSGTGKSTHTRLWREMLGERAVMINDDKPFLKIDNGGIWVYGSPWQGKHNLGNNISAELMGVCVLSQAKENSIVRLSPNQAVTSVMNQCHIPKHIEGADKALTLVDKLLQSIPIYSLACDISLEAAKLSYCTMVKG